MIKVFAGSWALPLGIMLLMVGNGVQGTLLGIRGDIEGFTTGPDVDRHVGLFRGVPARVARGTSR